VLLALIASVSLVQNSQQPIAKIGWKERTFDFGVTALVPNRAPVTQTGGPHDNLLKSADYRYSTKDVFVRAIYKEFDPKGKDLDLDGEYDRFATDEGSDSQATADSVVSEDYVLLGTYKALRLTLRHAKTDVSIWSVQNRNKLYKFVLTYPKSATPPAYVDKFVKSIRFKTPKSPADTLVNSWHTIVTDTKVSFESPIELQVSKEPHEVRGVQLVAGSYSGATPTTYYLVADYLIPAEYYSTLNEDEAGKMHESLHDMLVKTLRVENTKQSVGALLGLKSIRSTFSFGDRTGVIESCLYNGNFFGVCYISYPKLMSAPPMQRFLRSIKPAGK